MRVYTISELQTYLTCPRLWYWEYARKLRSKKFGGLPLEVGTSVHEGIAKIYSGIPLDEAVNEVLFEYDRRLSKWTDEYGMDSKEGQRIYGGRLQVQTMLSGYPWAKTDFSAIEAIEESFVMDMGQGRAYGGQWDRKLGWSGRDFLHDTKTTGEVISHIVKVHKMRMQYKAYAYAWRALKKTTIDGFVMDFIAKPRINWKRDGSAVSSVSYAKKDMNPYHREPFVVKTSDYHYFPHWFHRVTESIERDMEHLSLAQSLEDGPFPVNSDSCGKWNRVCDFYDLDRAANSKMQEALASSLFVEKEEVHGAEYVRGLETD